MKLSEFTNCYFCDKGMAHAGIAFYKLTLDYLILDLNAIRRAQGLELQLGKAAPLASVLGPNEDLAKSVQLKEICVCLDCALTKSLVIGEVGNE